MGGVISGSAIDVSAVLDSVDDDEPMLVVDLVDDAVVAPAGYSEAREATGQRLAEPLRVLGKRSEDRLGDRGANLLREPADRAGAFGGGPEAVHPACSETLVQWQQFPLVGLQLRLAQRVHQLVVAENVDGLL